MYIFYFFFSISRKLNACQLCNRLQPRHSEGMKHTILVLEERRHHGDG